MQMLEADETTAIKIVPYTDSICAPCPHRRNLRCDSQEKIDRLDQAHANALHIKTNTTITWQDAKEKIKQHLTLEQFHAMCEPCEWKKLGICENILTQFLYPL